MNRFFCKSGLKTRSLSFNTLGTAWSLVLSQLVLVTNLSRKTDLDLKSHSKDWRSLGSNLLPLVYKVSSFTTTTGRLLMVK